MGSPLGARCPPPAPSSGSGVHFDSGQGYLNPRAAPWVARGLRVVKPVVEHRGWKRMMSMEYLGYGRGYLLVRGLRKDEILRFIGGY